MMENNTFEEQLNRKLNSIQPEYQPKYWDQYMATYGKKRRGLAAFLPFLPYAFSAILFVLGWWLHDYTSNHDRRTTSAATTDTLYVFEQVNHRDTIVVRDTLYIVQYQSEKNNSARRGVGLGANTGGALLTSNAQYKEATQQGNTTAQPGHPPRTEKRAEQNTASEESTTEKDSDEPRVKESETTREEKNEESLVQSNNGTPTQRVVEKVDSSDVEEKQNKSWDIRGGVGLGVLGVTQIRDNYIESSQGGAVGLHATLSFQRFGLRAGAYYGAFHHEIDDVELTPADRLLAYPGHALAVNNIDDIVVMSRNLLIPMSLSWRVFQQRQLMGYAHTGVLGNWLIRENFRYVLDFPEDQQIDFNANTSSFVLSHASLGIGIGYEIKQKWQLGLETNYYHPLGASGSFGFSKALIGAQLTLIRSF